MAKKRVYNKSTGRDYGYDKEYQATREHKKDRAARNNARREAIRKGTARKGDGTDVDHKNGNPRDNRASNKHVISKSKNRSKK